MNFSSERLPKALLITSNVAKLDTLSAPDLKSLVTFENKSGFNQVILDLANTKYCDSSGLSAILMANRMCKDTNGRLIICGCEPAVMKIIEIAQLDKVLLITANVDEAKSHIE